MSIKRELIRVVVNPDESWPALGFVIPIGDGLARTMDDSMCRYNPGDPRRVQVLYRECDGQKRVVCDHAADYRRFKGVVEQLGGHVEPISSLDEAGRKVIVIAYPARIDAVALAEALGLRSDT
jgi:hypothetical protein